MADVKGLTWTMPIEDAVALGRVLYWVDDDGLTQGDIEAADRVFEALDDFLTVNVGENWLGSVKA